MAVYYAPSTNGKSGSSAEQLLARLEEPRTAEALNTLLDHAELLAFSATAFESFLRRGDRIAENLSEGLTGLREVTARTDFTDLQEVVKRTPHFVNTAIRLTELVDNPEFERSIILLSNPDMLRVLNQLLSLLPEAFPKTDTAKAAAPAQPDALETLHKLVAYVPQLVNAAPHLVQIAEQSMADSQNIKRQIGPMGVLKALRDTDVQRAVTLVLVFAKRLGAWLRR